MGHPCRSLLSLQASLLMGVLLGQMMNFLLSLLLDQQVSLLLSQLQAGSLCLLCSLLPILSHLSKLPTLKCHLAASNMLSSVRGAGGGTKTMGVEMTDTEVPVSEVAPCPDPGLGSSMLAGLTEDGRCNGVVGALGLPH